MPGREADLGWARNEPVRSVRWLIQRGVSLPVTRLVANPQVEGREWLRTLDRPAIFVSNHVSHADTVLILYALPDDVREKTVVGAAADYWYEHPWLGRAVSLWLNTFPFARTGSPKTVLRDSEQVLRSGWHLLMYPEGTRSTDGRMQEFKPGVGYLATEARAAVVPIHIRGSHEIMPKGRPVPLPAQARLRIGKPLWPCKGERARPFTARLEEAVRQLASSSERGDARGTWMERWRATKKL
jgi:1-acyl-sn-glycerol-3-phosphate acyltransferase